MNRLVVFDCDGTLVDSQANIVRAMEIAFDIHRLPPPDPHATRRVVGLSLVQAMCALLPGNDPALHEALAESYKRAFQTLRADGHVNEPLFPGIARLLDEIDARGWLMGVATGKSNRGLGLCLAHHGIGSRFVTLQTADRHPSKPHPAMLNAAMAEAGATPQATLMIGDTSFDMAMGCAAGARSVGVTWGYHDAHELHEAGAQYVIDTADALIALMEEPV